MAYRPFCPRAATLFAFAATAYLTACGGSATGSGSSALPMTMSLPVSSIDVEQDGNLMPSVAVTVSNAPGTVTTTVTGLPAGISAQVTQSGTTPMVMFSGGPGVAAGTYTATVTAVSGTQTVSQPLSVVNDVVSVVNASVDTSLGVNGNLEQFMATSFQIAQWTGDIFGSGSTAAARESELTNIGAQHLRMQVVAGGMPMVSNTGTAADWDFSTLDTTVQPVLASADHSPEFQIATAPAWMCDSNGDLKVAAHAQDFAVYAANLVRYYNKGGFDWGGQHFQSPSGTPITWWGIFNEYNVNGLSAADYVTLYNTVVPEMLAVDPTIRFSALEFSDWGLGTADGGDPMVYLPAFLAGANAGGVNTQVDVLSTHFYGTCNQKDTDTTLFAQPPLFAQNIAYFYKALATRPDLQNTQVWVTENNVNADYSDANGMSTCNPGQVFVADQRGTSAFFAAWRPLVFSLLGKAGNRALYHWAYSGDQQYGEVDADSNTYLSYWVDQELAKFFPSAPEQTGEEILQLSSTDATTVETLAVKSSDGTLRIMVVDYAVKNANDNNGTGAPRTVAVELSGLGSFSTAALLTIDANTSVTSGPSATSITPSSRIPITLGGYGVAFLTLKP